MSTVKKGLGGYGLSAEGSGCGQLSADSLSHAQRVAVSAWVAGGLTHDSKPSWGPLTILTIRPVIVR